MTILEVIDRRIIEELIRLDRIDALREKLAQLRAQRKKGASRE